MGKKNNQKAAKTRQKKLAKRKTEQKVRKKADLQLKAISLKDLFKNPTGYPLMESLITTSVFDQSGIGFVVLSWKMPNKKIVMANILVDPLARGIKDVFMILADSEEYYGRLDYIESDLEFQSYPPESIKKYLMEMEAFFAPHNLHADPDYKGQIIPLLEQYDETECDEDFIFGEYGKPYFADPFYQLKHPDHVVSYDQIWDILEGEYYEAFDDADEDHFKRYDEEELAAIRYHFPEQGKIIFPTTIWNKRREERELLGKLSENILTLAELTYDDLINRSHYAEEQLNLWIRIWALAVHAKLYQQSPLEFDIELDISNDEIETMVAKKERLYPDDLRIITDPSFDETIPALDLEAITSIDRMIATLQENIEAFEDEEDEEEYAEEDE